MGRNSFSTGNVVGDWSCVSVSGCIERGSRNKEIAWNCDQN
jgi:hypothetical protein